MQLAISLPTAILLLTLPLMADWRKEVTNRPPDPRFSTIKPVHLHYQMNWDGKINSGDMNILIGRKDPRYPRYLITQIYGSSTGLARGIYPYDYSFTSFLGKKNYLPSMFTATETTRKARCETNNWYRPSVRSREITTPRQKGKPSKTRNKTFSFSGAPIYDLASSLLYLRSLDLKTGQETVMVVHPFASPYLARIKVLRREAHRGLNCLKMDLRLNKIGPDGKLLDYDKLKKDTLWLSDDRERLPIEIRSEVFIGDVRAVLVGKKYL